jgi:hypothetical protein
MEDPIYFFETPHTHSGKLKGIVPALFSNTIRQYMRMNALWRHCGKLFLEFRKCLHALEFLPAILQTMFMGMIQPLGVIGQLVFVGTL